MAFPITYANTEDLDARWHRNRSGPVWPQLLPVPEDLQPRELMAAHPESRFPKRGGKAADRFFQTKRGRGI